MGQLGSSTSAGHLYHYPDYTVRCLEIHAKPFGLTFIREIKLYVKDRQLPKCTMSSLCPWSGQGLDFYVLILFNWKIWQKAPGSVTFHSSLNLF